MQNTKLIGRIIFANLLDLSLEKYKNFIKAVEESLLFDKLQVEFRRLSRARISSRAKEAPSKAVAEITRNGKDFSVTYACEGFSKVYI